MGVRYLAEFIRNGHRNECRLADCVKDCDNRLVIDGNNLHHFLFCDSNSRHKARHGGDLDLYACEVERFFGCLERLGITSYIIFDGFDRENNKVRESRIVKSFKTIEDLLIGRGSRVKLSCLSKRVSNLPF